MRKFFNNLLAPVAARFGARQSIDDHWHVADMLGHRQRLATQWLRGEGIEIGALHVPLKVAEGVRVRYVDYKTKTENEARYPELGEFDIVETDLVDDGFILAKIPDGSNDFLIANHALEHSPDPYGTLLAWKGKLRPGGLLYFALPMAEQCFDRGRPLTTLAHLEEDHRLFLAGDVTRVLEVTEGHLREFFQISDANIRRDNQITDILDDERIDKACKDLMAKLRAAVTGKEIGYQDLISAHVSRLNKAYDIHYHTFSPSSLAAFMRHFCEHEGCELVELVKSGGGECIVILRHAPR